MIRYIIRRLLAVLLIIVLISIITFLIFFALPSNPALLACGKSCTPDRIAQIKHSMGLDQSLVSQYLHYMGGIFAGRTFGDNSIVVHCHAPCLGISFKTDEPVWSTLMNRVPATLSIALGAAVIFLIVGVTLGVVAAVNRGKALDKFAIGFALVGVSLQIFFTGLLSQYIFVNQLHWLPQSTYTPLTQNFGQWFEGLILPWVTLAFLYLAFYSRLTRANMLDVMSQDYIRTARAKGLSRRKVIVKHSLRAAITPVVTIFGMDFGMLVGGQAVITESVFGINGVGKLAVDSVTDSDLPVIMGTVLFAAIAIVLANLVIDIIYGFIDPRVRYS